MSKCGSRRIWILLNREGWQVTKYLVERVYSKEGLALRGEQTRRHKMMVRRQRRMAPSAANQAWSLDFISDQLSNQIRFRALTIVDVFTREAMAVDMDTRLRDENVVAAFNRFDAQRGRPLCVADNGNEFSGRLVDVWADHHGVRIDFRRPGKPTDKALIETFNVSLRDECLNFHRFDSIEHTKSIIEARRHDYDESRPHMAPNNVPPAVFGRQTLLQGKGRALSGR
ncbi:transposase (plasmid) [Pararobbsia alpina]